LDIEMNCLPPSAKFFLCVAFAALATRQAGAQEGIIFSKPPADPAAKANSFLDQTAHRDTAEMKLPTPLFNGTQPSANFDAASVMQRPSPRTAEQIQLWQKEQSEKNNWALMTSAEIFGVQTPEQILGKAMPEDEKNLSAAERYLRRQQTGKSYSVTNSLRPVGGTWADENNPFKPAENKQTQAEKDYQARRTGIFQTPFNTIAPPTRNDNNIQRRENSLWQSSFSVPTTDQREDPEQIAAMDRFRSLLESGPAADAQSAQPSAALFKSPAPAAVVPEYKPPTAYIPAANFEAQRQQQISKPIGIAPLPPISARASKTDNNSTLVKSPPWLSEQPQPNAPPQWKNF
jgi:hypothetical protein